MFFADYETHKKEKISQSILWEYDTKAPDWDWNIMAKTVVARVLEYGRPEDYYAMFQLYGGFEKVKNIVVQIPYLPPKELNWSCLLFDLKKEDFLCCKKNTVEKTAFELLRTLMKDSQIDQFFLVGGTSIALRLGHRKSIDLDLFTQNDISVQDLNKHLSKEYGFIERYKAHNTLKGEINGVFIDCIKYDYPLLKPLSTEENIRIASFEDVIAMKLSAITDNGTRLKDFVDISFLSTKYSLEAMLDFYRLKYKNVNILSVVKALSYFDDIDFMDEPVNLIAGKFNWEHIEKRLHDMIKNPQKIYKTYPI